MAKNPYFDDGDEAAPSWEEGAPAPAAPSPAAPSLPAPNRPRPPARPPAPAVPQQPVYQPAPQQPVYQPAPEQPVYQPAPQQPVYQPAPQQPVYQPAPQQPVYQPAPEQPAAQEPAQQPAELPQRQRSTRTTRTAAPQPLPDADTFIPGVGVVDEAPAGSRRLVRRKGQDPDQFKAARAAQMAGGRWRLIAFRVTTWAVLAILGLSGIRATLFPATPSIDSLTAEVSSKLGVSGFPTQAGMALAQRFTRVYLTIDPKRAAQRSQELATYLPGGKTQVSWIYLNQSANQAIIDGPYLSEKPHEESDGQRAVFTFAAQIIDPTLPATDAAGKPHTGRWVYLAVTVFSGKDGLSIAGPPAYMPGPAIGTIDAGFPFKNSPALVSSLTSDLRGFFTAWAASDSAGLKRYLLDSSGPVASTGLGGSVQLKELRNLQVNAGAEASGLRYAQVDVLWTSGGIDWVQGYRLMVLQGSDQKWYVQEVYGGIYGNAGQ